MGSYADGRPGVWSSSFGGEEGNHARNNLRMMEELRRAGVKPGDKPSARFRCVMVLARNGSVLAEFSGSVEGHMLPGCGPTCWANKRLP